MTLAKMFVAQGRTAQAAGNSVSLSQYHCIHCCTFVHAAKRAAAMSIVSLLAGLGPVL